MSDLTPAQQLRADFEAIHSWRKENNKDTISLMQLTAEIVHSCMDEGIRSEKVCMKAEGGSVELTERFPQVALNGIRLIHDMGEDAYKRLEKAPPPDTTINISINRKRLEDTMAEDSDKQP